MTDRSLLEIRSAIFRYILVYTVTIAINFIVVPKTIASQGTTIGDVLSITFANNPQILAERAKSRATSEGVAIAVAAARPSVALSGSYGWQRNTESSLAFPQGQTNPQSEEVTVSQPIFDGRIGPGIKQARAQASADQAELTATEQSILLSAENAFVEVIRDEKIVSLYRDDIAGLVTLEASVEKRVAIGELTRTDLAQVSAQLAETQTSLAGAEQQSRKSRADFEHVVGSAPQNLVPPAFATVPMPEENVLRLALKGNPVLREDEARMAAAKQAVHVAAAGGQPTVSFQAQYGRTDNEIAPGVRENGASVMGQVSIPLYQGGKISAAVRQAKDDESQAENTVVEAERQVREDTVTAWDAMQAAKSMKDLALKAVASYRAAYVGAQAESRVGTRTIFDILNADQAVLQAQISQVSADCSYAEAIFRLENEMGATKP